MDSLKLNLSLIRIRHALRKRQAQRDGIKRTDDGKEPYAWITLKNGEHIPLNPSGEAVGGAGGWAEGKRFSKAVSIEKEPGTSIAREKSPGKGTVKTVSVKKTSSVKEKLVKRASSAVKKCGPAYRKLKKLTDKYSEWIEKEKQAEEAYERTVRSFEIEKNISKKEREKLKDFKSEKTEEELEKELDAIQKKIDDLGHEQLRHYSDKDKWNELKTEIGLLEKEKIPKEKELDNLKTIRASYTMERMGEEAVKDCKAELEQIKSEEPETLKAARERYEELSRKRDEAILKAYPSPEACETSEEVENYLKAKGYYCKENEDAFEESGRVDIKKMNSDMARMCAMSVDRLMTDYPWIKGKLDGLECHDFSEDGNDKTNYMGYVVNSGTMICLAQGYYGNASEVPEEYRNNAAEAWSKGVSNGTHPQGTDCSAIIDHESTHAMENYMRKAAQKKGIALFEGSVANTVMKRVQERLYGEYSIDKESEVREGVSRYANNNPGYNETYGEWVDYGRNTEFLAEAMGEARNSKNPREIAKVTREVFEELMKEVGLL